MLATKPITLATAKAVAAGNSCRQEDVIVAANMGRKAIFDLLRACKVFVFSFVLHVIVLYGIVLYAYCIVLYRIVLSCTALPCIVFYCFVIYNVALFGIAYYWFY